MADLTQWATETDQISCGLFALLAKITLGRGSRELFTLDLHGRGGEIYLPLSGCCHFFFFFGRACTQHFREEPIMACCLLMASAVASCTGKSQWRWQWCLCVYVHALVCMCVQAEWHG